MDDELEPKKDPIDLKTEVGLSRREMLRRSAIVGGALVWSVPAIQSMGMKAAAAQAGPGPSPGQCGACYCFTLKNNGKVRKEFGFNGPLNTPGLADQSDCTAFCAHTGAYLTSGGAPGGPFAHGDYCSGTGTCTVVTGQKNKFPVSPNPVCS